MSSLCKKCFCFLHKKLQNTKKYNRIVKKGGVFMSYDSLYKLYYKDKELYKSTYDNRINSENTIKFDFKIYGNDAFVFLHKDIMSVKPTANNFFIFNLSLL